jgi:hypothetical protein
MPATSGRRLSWPSIPDEARAVVESYTDVSVYDRVMRRERAERAVLADHVAQERRRS